MATVFLSPVFQGPQFANNGDLLVGGFIYTFVAGSSTPLVTYTDNIGIPTHTNPIVLDARGESATPIWLLAGQAYKLRLFDSLNNFLYEYDYVTGIGDTSITIDQWIASNIPPTYVNATTFTLPGDQTSNFQIGRRVKSTVTAGTAYGTISNSVFGALTTVTLVNDSGSALDSGLSAVSYGIITPQNTSFPYGLANYKGTTAGTAPTYTFTPIPPITSYSLLPRLTVQFNASNGSVASTLNISGLGAKSLKQLDGSGAKIDPVIILNQLSDIEYDGTDLILLDALPASSTFILNRNSIQYGPVTTTNLADLIPQSQVGNTNAAGVTLKCSTSPTFFSAANGFNADGSQKNFNRVRTTDLVIPNLTNSADLWIYYDPSADTAGFTPIVSNILYQYGGVIPVTNNRYTYDYLNHIMYLGNGATATAVTRIIITRVTTSPTNVTAISVSQNGNPTGNIPYNAMFKNQIVELGDYRTLTSASQDWNGIPSWARRITFDFVGLSSNGTSVPILQAITNTSVIAAGYLGAASFCGATTGAANYTTGFGINASNAAANVYHGKFVLELADLATNTWVCSLNGAYSSGAFTIQGGGSVPLSGLITGLRITTVGGADTFDAGSAKVTFE